MAGPYQPYQGTDPYPGPPRGYPEPYPGASYPGTLPPPVQYPPRRRGRTIAIALASLAVIAGLVTAAVFASRDGAPAQQSVTITDAATKQAIQRYLDALSNDDIETISRNMLCGLYDGVRDRRTDDALARMSSEAFQKQFTRAQVTSVDTIVFASPNSAQVLFTMKIIPAASSRTEGGVERQAVAQVLVHDGQLLVCSYVLRTAGTF